MCERDKDPNVIKTIRGNFMLHLSYAGAQLSTAFGQRSRSFLIKSE